MSVELDVNAWSAIWRYKRTQRPIERAGWGNIKRDAAAAEHRVELET